MIFSFYNYLKPIWYFNLRPAKDFGYFPTLSQLDRVSYPYTIDLNYKSQIAQQKDVAWTAFQQGFINKLYEPGLDIWRNEKIPVIDEYIFLRKNFHKAWVVYVLLLRIITFHNPISEIFAFLKSSKIKRFDYHRNHFENKGYVSFDSQLVKEQPLVSIIIPTLNRYAYLKDVMRDLENQTYKNFEVIIVDQTDAFQE